MGEVQEINNQIIAELRGEIEELIKCNKDLAKANDRHKEKVERYEKALNHIATRKMSTYLSTSHMNQDFIKTAIEALKD